jgi:hypothetical protein
MAVRRWFPSQKTRVLPRVTSREICSGGRSTREGCSSSVLVLPCRLSLHHCSIPIYHRPKRWAIAVTKQYNIIPSVLSYRLYLRFRTGCCRSKDSGSLIYQFSIVIPLHETQIRHFVLKTIALKKLKPIHDDMYSVNARCLRILHVMKSWETIAVHPCCCRQGRTMSLNCGHHWAYCSSSIWYMNVESHGGMTLTGKYRRTLRNACPSATLSTTNSAWNEAGAIPGLRGERPAANRLRNGTAFIRSYLKISVFISY